MREGDSIGIYYDPMISKLVCWGETRLRALERMESALRQYEVGGVVTNIPFLLNCVTHPVFRQGGVETGFIADNLQELIPRGVGEGVVPVAIAALALLLRGKAGGKGGKAEEWTSSWARGDNWRVNLPSAQAV